MAITKPLFALNWYSPPRTEELRAEFQNVYENLERLDAHDRDDRYLNRLTGGTVNDTINLYPPEGESSIALRFNHNYELYVDNTGVGSHNSRMWFNAPHGGEVVIGPRTGADYLHRIRHRAIIHRFESTAGYAAEITADTATGLTGSYVNSSFFRGTLFPEDTRSANEAPSWYSRGVIFEFKSRTAVGLPGSGTYSGLMTFKPWQNTSGGRVYQLGFTEAGIYAHRSSGDHISWESWTALGTF